MINLSPEQEDFLIEEIKIYLRQDEPLSFDDKLRIRNYIYDGINFLQGYTGTILDFSGGEPRRLLKDYVRYSYHNASEYFEGNYAEALKRLQWDEATKSYTQSMAGGNLNITTK